MDEIGLDSSGISLDCGAVDLNLPQTNLGFSSDDCLQSGDDFLLSQPQGETVGLPDHLIRNPARPKPTNGQVIAPGVLPLQLLRPTQQPSYQVHPGYLPQPICILQSPHNGAAVIYSNNGFPLHTFQPTNHVQHTVTPVNTHMPIQRQGAVIVPPIPPPNWMGMSIISAIFFTLPFGIIALFFSFQVNDSYRRGDHQKALSDSNIAKWLNLLSVIIGLPLYGSLMIYIILK